MIFDNEQRRRAIQETDKSFVVEASAGTGKTRTLIDRILYLVLKKGPTGQPLPLSRICAITFTEKAAGEMKIRLRQQFEEAASLMNDRAALAREALNDLETAAISTFHSFAVSLLKERPIEAGLDPRFTSLDEIQSELFFREVWQAWISRALAEREAPLERALRSGLRLGALEELAGTLRLNSYAVRTLTCDSPPSEDQVPKRIRDLLQRGRIFLDRISKPEDKLAGHLEKALNWLENPNRDCTELSKPGNAGSAANWSGGKETVQAVREFVREVLEFCTWQKMLPFQRLLHELISWMAGDFLAEWEKRKRDRGLLDFDDQLWMARDLLIKNPAVRREFQEQFVALLVDEFQDTDPVQWDLVRLLSSTDLKETNLELLRPEPGRLFIVGDPKQSIYRFRSADIETYNKIIENRKSLDLERLQLTTNFRSIPSILRFVDAAFESVMKPPENGGSYQPNYLAFGDLGDRRAELSSPSVYILGDKKGSDATETVREFSVREASRISKLISRIHESESWKIRDVSEKKGEAWRAPRYGDIAILLPVLTRADILEEALREAGIPYVLEGGKFYYARSEVSSAITVLRAIANPNDSVALYGALRSIFFGLSDEDLLRAHVEGQTLDYRVDTPGGSPLYHPFEILRDLHEHRQERRASETLEVLLQKTGAREVLAVRGFQSLANLNKLARALRAFQGETTFSQAVDLLRTMDEEGLAESESRLMEERSDAVRVMSIHKAKGLDFPIVIVAALGLKKQTRSKSFLADLHQKKIFALNLGSVNSSMQTPSWKELADEEKKRENAELVRLLYVALTRAKDHLIVCTHTKGWKKIEGSENYVPDTEGTRLKPLAPFLADCLSGESSLVRWIDVDSLDAAASPRQKALLTKNRDIGAILRQEYQELHALLRDTRAARDLRAAAQGEKASAVEDHPAEDRMPEAPRSRAVRLGVAFHEAMERVDLLRLDGLTEFMLDVGLRHKLDEGSMRTLEVMMRASWFSGLLERARNAARSGGRILREVPFVRPLNSSGIEEGKIDLLFEEEDGWVLVDYKTDRLPENQNGVDEFFRDKYAGQIREYAEALASLSVKVKSAYLLLARTGNFIAINL